jgi:hypothetical protein
MIVLPSGSITPTMWHTGVSWGPSTIGTPLAQGFSHRANAVLGARDQARLAAGRKPALNRRPPCVLPDPA